MTPSLLRKRGLGIPGIWIQAFFYFVAAWNLGRGRRTVIGEFLFGLWGSDLLNRNTFSVT